MDSSIAQRSFEFANNIQEVDNIFKYDHAAQQQQLSAKPWRTDPNYFKHVKVSAIALLKMVMHARSGGDIEVMGIMQGKIDGDTMIVMDAYALPVEGTETRVNAASEAYEYMVEYATQMKKVGRLENVLGWYHSHPGYGCWLSGIDVSTQELNQQYTEPFLAVVIDPTRTAAAGKVEIGAFRTYPTDYTPPDESPSEYQTIPMDKIEDFGVHCKRYYPLDITYFKSSLDTHMLNLLWNRYWVNTLSSSPMLANRAYTSGQVCDLAEKLEQAEGQMAHTRGISGGYFGLDKKKEDSQLTKINRDSTKIAIEQMHGLMAQVIKSALFSSETKP